MSKKLVTITIASFALYSAQALALGLGNIELGSGLNQPFNATIKLVSRSESELEGLRIGLASNADFDRIGAVRLPFLNGLKFEIITPESGKPYITVTSTQPIREPFVDFIIEANWPAGRLLREYTVLLDPPTLTTERAAPVQAPSVSRAPVASAPQVSRPGRQEQTPSGGGIIQPTTTASAPDTGGLVFGPVGSSDTLWNIANLMRPNDSVSVQQMMIALLKENPDAFGDNNINTLKAGSTLEIEDQSVITELNHREALNETSRQYQNWLAAKEARRAARGQIAKQETVTRLTDSNAGEASDSTSGANVDSTPEGGLRLLADDALEDRPVQGGVADVEGVDEEVGALREELELTVIAAEAASEKNAELGERMVALEEQVAAMERALQLRNDDVALLQQKLGQATGDLVEGVADADAGVIETLPLEPEQEVDITNIISNDIEPDSVAVSEVDGDGIIDNIVRNASDIGSSLKDNLSGFFSNISLDSVKEALQPENILERYRDNTLIFRIVSGITVLLVIMGLVVRRRRVAAEEQFEEFVPQQTADAEPNVEEVEQDEFGIGATESEADVLNEADVYISYQRYDKAETILKYAIDSEPRRIDLKAKLLEVYYAAKNVPAFVASTDEYYAALSDDQTIWSKVNVMGLELVPGHYLFSGDSAAASEFDSMEGFDELSELDDIDANDTNDAGLDSDDYADIDLEMDVLTADGDVWQEDDNSSTDNEVNVPTVDEPSASDKNETSDSAEVLYEEASVDPDNEFDLDLDIDMDDTSPTLSDEVAIESSEQVEIVSVKTEPLELDLPADQESSAELAEEPSEEPSELSLSLLERAMDSVDENGDAASFNEKFGTTNTGDDGLGESLSTYNPDDDEGYDPSLFVGVDVVSTKLDLAKAYIDMGDQDGARSILSEVVAEGNDDQQKEAEELLGQL